MHHEAKSTGRVRPVGRWIGWRLGLLLLLAAPLHALPPTTAAPAARQQRVAFLRQGDLYLQNGAVETRLTRGRSLEGIAYTDGKIAAVEAGRLVTLELARPRVVTVSLGRYFLRTPQWLRGGKLTRLLAREDADRGGMGARKSRWKARAWR